MADTIKTNLGPVTAYADAKAHGYTGTREEFGQLLANAGLNLKAAETAKADAEAAKQAAETAQQAAAENQKNTETQAANAKASADTAAEQAAVAEESAADAANSATAAQESENNAGLSATAAANAEAAAKQAQNAAETAKADAETAKTAAGNSADAAANSAADAKKTLESIPADYSTLSGKVDENANGISELKEDIADLLEKDIAIIEGYYLGLTGFPTSDSRYKISDYIKVFKKDIIKVKKASASNQVCLVYFYDDNKNRKGSLLNGKGYGEYINTELVIREDGYIRVSYYDTTEYVIIPNIPTIQQNIFNLDKDVDNLKNPSESPLSNINSSPSFISSFRKIFCIGDSLTEGICNTTYPNDTTVSFRDFSYPAVLGKLTGCTVYNKGMGSRVASTAQEAVDDLTSYLTSAARWNFFTDDNKSDLYIIALGTNDITKFGSFVGDVETDIDVENSENNAKNSVGGYASIIQKVKEHQPRAKIMCVTISNERNDYTSRTEANEKIKKIAAKFEGCYVIDLQKYAETTEQEVNYFIQYYKNGSHNNALGYNLRARQFISYIDWIIKNNIKDFQDIQYIGTDYKYID